MIRIRQHAGLAALVVLALATTTYAQNQQRGRGGFGGGFRITEGTLLRAEVVQKELKVTDEQKGKIETALRDATPSRDAFSGFQDLSQEERTKRMAEFAKKAEEAGKKAKEALNADQNKRLREIYIQMAGTDALSNAEVAAALKITDDQKKQLTKINEDNQAKGREIGFGEGSREKRDELRKDTDAKTVAVLTADQKKQLEEMKGAKVPFERTALFGGFGGGRKKNN